MVPCDGLWRASGNAVSKGRLRIGNALERLIRETTRPAAFDEIDPSQLQTRHCNSENVTVIANFKCCVALIVLAANCFVSNVGTVEAAGPYEVTVVKDVHYLATGRKEKLDLYLPIRSPNERVPAIVIVHGGGWHGGDKAASREQNIGTNLAKAGFACASINYRLCMKDDNIETRLRNVWPHNLHDCKTAVRFLRANADKYAIDAEHIGAIGGSAGGHLVAMMAVTDADDRLEPEGPFAEHSSRIQAVVPMYGVHDVLVQARTKGNTITESGEALCRNASPVTWISSDDPPALILHGTKDALVPVEQSTILHKQLKKARVESSLMIIEGAPHSFHLQPKQQDLRSTVTEFFNRHLRAK